MMGPSLRLAFKILIGLLAGLAALVAVVQLERARQGIVVEDRVFAESPATLYTPRGAADGPLVVVAHGFAGSRQMMEAISLTLARSGLRVVAFDFAGHGENDTPLSRNVAEIDGTTAQLVAQTRAVVAAARETLVAGRGPAALVGHSMATDVIVRAAQDIPGIAAVVAISMYSEAVTPDHPERLLIVSGAWENRLRDVALEAVHQIAPGADEGETVRDGDVMRRAVAAPYVEHVGVLYSPTTLSETRDWLGAAFGQTATAPPAATGPWLALLMGALLVASWPAAGLAAGAPHTIRPLPPLTLTLVVAVPVVPAVAAALAAGGDLMGFAGFRRLAVFFGVFGTSRARRSAGCSCCWPWRWSSRWRSTATARPSGPPAPASA